MNEEHSRQSIGLFFKIFAILILLISALTSFAFFYTFLPGLVPQGVLDGNLGKMFSGFVGVLLLDIATVLWLNNFLHNSETSEQRSIALIMTTITFVGSAVASIAYIGLKGEGELTLTGETRGTIGIVSLFMVIGTIVLNFAAVQFHTRYSLASKNAVRESDRLDRLAKKEAENAKILDNMVAQQLAQEFEVIAPGLAASQAKSLATKMYSTEMLKVTNKPTNRLDSNTMSFDVDPEGNRHILNSNRDPNFPKV